jgi:hypothetical protein
MNFAMGPTPEWKGKPKASPLDGDADFQELVAKITSGSLEVGGEGAGLFINQVEDGKRLGAKNPARMVRDHVNRILKQNELEDDHDVTCRQTKYEGVWAVWVTRLDVAGPNRRKSA